MSEGVEAQVMMAAVAVVLGVGLAAAAVVLAWVMAKLDRKDRRREDD